VRRGDGWPLASLGVPMSTVKRGRSAVQQGEYIHSSTASEPQQQQQQRSSVHDTPCSA